MKNLLGARLGARFRLLLTRTQKRLDSSRKRFNTSSIGRKTVQELENRRIMRSTKKRVLSHVIKQREHYGIQGLQRTMNRAALPDLSYRHAYELQRWNDASSPTYFAIMFPLYS